MSLAPIAAGVGEFRSTNRVRILTHAAAPKKTDAWSMMSDIERFVQLRAIEWASWPAFISQPLIPLLYLVCPWWAVLLGVAAVTFFWTKFCTRVANIKVATFGVYFASTKWITIPAACLILLLRHHYALATLALCTPIAAGVLGPMALPGPIEMRFYEQLGAFKSQT